nr:exo-beta-N-acetylmuramidase NamZ domain-containing protein [Acetobacter persici]
MTHLPRRALARQSGKALLGLGGAFVASRLASGVPAQAATPAHATPCQKTPAGRVKIGFEKLREQGYAPLRGHKVGVIANVASVDNSLTSIVDCLHQAPGVQLQAIFGPEHGFRGSMREGFSEPEMQDSETGCTVYDIYTKTGDALKNILKKSAITLLVFDIQDTGSRFYTYIWTLYDCMMRAPSLGSPCWCWTAPTRFPDWTPPARCWTRDWPLLLAARPLPCVMA